MAPPLASPIPNIPSLLASPTPNVSSLLAPPAHGDWPLGPTRGPTVQRASGGAWGDASPQTPAKHTTRASRGLTMGDGLLLRPLPAPYLSASAAAPGVAAHPPVIPCHVPSTRSVWRGSGGRHLPRLPRRRAGPSAAAEGPVSHGRGGREKHLSWERGGRERGSLGEQV